jgi:hypothetical protein
MRDHDHGNRWAMVTIPIESVPCLFLKEKESGAEIRIVAPSISYCVIAGVVIQFRESFPVNQRAARSK